MLYICSIYRLGILSTYLKVCSVPTNNELHKSIDRSCEYLKRFSNSIPIRYTIFERRISYGYFACEFETFQLCHLYFYYRGCCCAAEAEAKAETDGMGDAVSKSLMIFERECKNMIGNFEWL